MCELFIVGDQVSNVDVAVVLFDKDVFSKLISVRTISQSSSDLLYPVPVDKGII